MSVLILKSGNSLNAGIDSLEFSIYKNRVLADGGFIVNEQAVKDAFAFAAAQKMTSSEVFSATSANWGVKLLGDKPAKLYSLFAASGDINIVVGSATAIAYNTDRYSVPVIELKASSNNALTSEGVANGVLNSGICVIARAPLLENNAAYGGTNYLSAASLSNNTESTTANESLKKRTHSVGFSKSGSSSAELWYESAYRYDSSANVSTATTLIDVTKWVSTASFLNNGQIIIYDNGAPIASGLPILANPFPDNISFNLGRERNTASASLDFTKAFYGDIAEAWCLINTTEDKMQALSVRGTEKYPRV